MLDLKPRVCSPPSRPGGQAGTRQGVSAISRRSLLRATGSSLLWLPAAKNGLATESAAISGFGHAKSCVIVFQFGGPSQQDLWDLKPDAPQEIRGEFQPISTNVPGLEIGELLPKLAQQADKYLLLRSVTHRDFEHGSASYTALTGKPHPLPGTNTPARREDFPTFASVVAKERPTTRPLPTAVVLGPVMHQGNRPPLAGQNSGFLGTAYDPYRIADDPNAGDFAVDGLRLPVEVAPERLKERFELMRQAQDGRNALDRTPAADGMNQLKRRVLGLLGSSASQQAFDLHREPKHIRSRYGRHRFGQTMLLTRRLVEAGTPLITVNWSKLNADQWDTHKQNYPKLKQLLPPFDQGMAAFLNDLSERGLLDQTLVVCLGEFGRTPKINKNAGRDHWPDCYTVFLAGGGLHQGQAYGASDGHAAYPDRDPVGPWDLTATCFHLLGIDPSNHIYDRERRPFQIADGRVLRDLIA